MVQLHLGPVAPRALAVEGEEGQQHADGKTHAAGQGDADPGVAVDSQYANVAADRLNRLRHGIGRDQGVRRGFAQEIPALPGGAIGPEQQQLHGGIAELVADRDDSAVVAAAGIAKQFQNA